MPRSTALVTVLLTMSLSSCGGGDSGSQANSASLPPPLATESPAQLAAIAAFSSLLDTPSHFLTAASATLSWDYMYAGSRARNECPISGFKQILLDGTAWTARFPAGKHTLAAQFQSCKFAGPMQDLLLNGSVEMVYEMSDIENVSAVLTFRQFTADLGLVAEGPATYVLEKSAQAERMLVDLRAGAALTNPETTKRVDFLSGRHSWTIDRAEPKREILEYAGVTLDLYGVRYVISGRQTYLGSRGDCEEGEIRITDGNGALVGRRYCAAGRSEYEVLKSIPSFW